MKQEQIKQLIESRCLGDGMHETGIGGVQLFRVTQSMPCIPAVYEPSVIAIVSGAKEAIVDGERYVYGKSHYLVARWPCR